MISPKDKAKAPKDSMTLLPCFYFVEVGVEGCGGGGHIFPSLRCHHALIPCYAWGSATTLCPTEWDLGGLWWAMSPPCLPPPHQLPIVASSIVTLYFLELTDLFKPAKVGFQCHDRALSMPYVESSEELIPLLMLLSLAFAAPAASVRPTPLWGRVLTPLGLH